MKGPIAWTVSAAAFLPVHGLGPTELKLGLEVVSEQALKAPDYIIREINVETEPDLECPQGFDRSGNACIRVKTTLAQKVCPPGWQNSMDGLCVGYSVADPDRTCDRGSPDYGKCVEEKSVPKQVICPDTFSLDLQTSSCIKDLSSSPIRRCPPGSVATPEGCATISKVSPKLTCPGSFHLKDGLCERVDRANAELFCPEGFLMHPIKKKCIQELESAPIRECLPGSTQRGLECYVQETREPNMMCHDQAQLENGLCKAFDRAAPTFRCEGNLRLNLLSQLCEGDEVASPIPECTKGTYFNPVTGQCGSTHFVKNPNLACPPDYHFSGKHHCVKHIARPGIKECPPDFALESKESCVRMTLTPPRITCPEGTIPQGSLCIREFNTPLQQYCPPELVMEGEICRGLTYAPATEKCPPNFFTVGDKEKICIRKDVTAPKSVCPTGTVPTKSGAKLVCLGQSPVTPSHDCPPSHKKTDDACIETLKLPSSLSCPPNYFEDMETGRCFQRSILPSRTVCPAGYKLVGKKCLKQHTKPPLYICPEGYQRSGNNECAYEEAAALLKICPFGFQYDKLHEVCVANKVKYEFEGQAARLATSTTPAPEKLLDMNVNPPVTTTTSTTTASTTTAAPIEIQITRPIVQKGLVVRNEVVTLSGPAAEVAKKQKLLAQGADIATLGDDVKVEYVPRT